MAPATALRVVSAPAENTSEKKAESSSSLSRGGSVSGSSACTTVESMSGPGWIRFSSIERGAVFVQDTDRCLAFGGHRQEVGFVGNVEDVLDGIEQDVSVRLRHPEEEADGLHRQLRRHVDQEVALVVD